MIERLSGVELERSLKQGAGGPQDPLGHSLLREPVADGRETPVQASDPGAKTRARTTNATMAMVKTVAMMPQIRPAWMLPRLE